MRTLLFFILYSCTKDSTTSEPSSEEIDNNYQPFL